MIVYKDQSWCNDSALGGCGNLDCFRNYSPAQREQNENGVDLPISVAGFRTKDCGYEEPED